MVCLDAHLEIVALFRQKKATLLKKISITFANFPNLLLIGPIARLVERWTHELVFMCSNPTWSNIIFHLSLLISLNNQFEFSRFHCHFPNLKYIEAPSVGIM